MGTVVIGNSNTGKKYWTNGYDNGMAAELMLENSFAGYYWTATSDGSCDTIEIGYYVRQPDSDLYWDWYDAAPDYAVPVVVALNEQLLPAELLSATVSSIIMNRNYGQWATATVALHRHWKAGETLFFGVYGNVLCPVWDTGRTDITGHQHEFETMTNTWGLSNLKLLYEVQQGTVLENTAGAYDRGCQFSIYARFTSPENYVRSITAKATIKEKFTRKAQYRKNRTERAQITQNMPARTLYMKRAQNEPVKIGTALGRTLYLFRSAEDTGTPYDWQGIRRTLRLFLKHAAGITAMNSSYLAIIRRLTASLPCTDSLTRKSHSARLQGDDVLMEAGVHGGRWITRAVCTAMSFWDAIRGRIRGENCTLRLYCPVVTELEIKGHLS